ncbi:MAG TPA: amidase [Vicinamibacterales bacterium]|nr:amidase [Vicinamibacterales bacterium]
MSATNLHTWTLSSLSDALRTKQASPVEITRACLERVEEHDGRINAFITTLVKPALAAASKAESQILKGRYAGPLHGVPYAVKDLFLTRGIRTTCGSKVLNAFVPSYNAAVVDRLDRAGGILLGKLNMHEFAFGATSVNPHYGAVRNPWDPSRMTGGSSGGSAAAIACSFAFLTLGTDTGGSVRIPASLCGVCGLKPTYGRVSRFGAYPLAWSMDHVGPIAGSVRDLALAMQLLAGPDRRDPSSARVPVPDYTRALEGDLEGVRLGVPDQFYFDGLYPEVRSSIDQALARLKQLGASVSPISLDLLPDAARAASIILFAEAAGSLEKWHRTRSEALGTDVRARLDAAANVSAADYLKALRIRRKVQGAFARAFRAVDALITPQLPVTAPLIDDTTVLVDGRAEPVPAALTRFTRIYNLTGMPCLSVCCGYSAAGLPIGLQIAGRPFDEAMVLRIGDAFERDLRLVKRPTLTSSGQSAIESEES